MGMARIWRMDLGECPNIHDLAYKADYERAAKNKDYYYDIDAMEHLQNFISDCDRKTEMAKRRLKETQEELSEEANAKADQIHQLGEQIGTKMATAEEMGAEGLVDESLKLMEEIEEIKKQKAQLEIEFRNSMPASSYQQQKLRVCEVCGAYLGIHDNDRRLADHFGGKLHLGFITIRTKLEELKQMVADRRAQREKEREEMRKKREEELAKQRSRSRSRERSRDKDRRRRSRSRDSNRRKRRSRSRSRDHRRRRSRSRDRRSTSSSRRRRSRSRSRRSRSRSGSRSKRSRRSRRSRSTSSSRRRRRRRRSSESESDKSRNGGD
ncbi:putative RNA-binding protein Alsin2 isoform X2 [Babylonia areolata]|uniref:putative RNA-binding protein Alsin2 isoform X2 n=1 Tax=Babylonia areolata TaxID=304850 RepID=UPI003FD26F5E